MDNIMTHFDSIKGFEDILFRADYLASTPSDGDFMDDLLNRYDDDGEHMYLSTEQADRLLRISDGRHA